MIRLSTKLRCLLIPAFLALGASAWAENPFIGRWALTIPGGAAGWLGIEEKDGELKGSLLWGGGSVLPVQSVKVDGDTLTVTRINKHRDAKTNTEDTFTDTITAKLSGDEMNLSTVSAKNDGPPSKPKEFTGKRIPPCRRLRTFRR
jgi:hypothetical protein